MSLSVEEASRRPHVTVSLRFTWPEHTILSSREAGNGRPLAGCTAAWKNISVLLTGEERVVDLRRATPRLHHRRRRLSLLRTLTTPAPCTCWLCPPP